MAKGDPHAQLPGRASDELVPARSVDSADVGQVMFINQRGDVVRPLWARAPRLAGTVAGGAIGLAVVAAVFTTSAGPLLGAGVLLGSGWMLWRLRHARAFRVAIGLAARGQRDDAYAAFLALQRKSLSAAFRDMVEMRLAGLETLRGAHGEAVRRLDALLPRLAARGRRADTWMAISGRAELAVITGDLDLGRRLQEELKGAPAGDFYELLKQSLALMIAFHGDTPATLPDDVTLHEWARAALGRTRFGGMLVTLSWAFLRRGDEPMARHLLSEAPSRLVGSYLPEAYPKLQAWMEQQTEAWREAD
jgi:hypothetical protein